MHPKTVFNWLLFTFKLQFSDVLDELPARKASKQTSDG